MGRFQFLRIVKTFTVLATLAVATPTFAGQDIRGRAAELQRQSCALTGAIQMSYHQVPEYRCLVNQAATLERELQHISMLLCNPRLYGKAEQLLDCAENHAEELCDRLDDANDHCSIPRPVRKRTNGLIGCIESGIDDLADALDDCGHDHHHHRENRGGYSNFPRQGVWAISVRR